MVRLSLKVLILFTLVSASLSAYRYSAGFRWDFISWGISGRYFLTPNLYIQGSGIFGHRKGEDNEWNAYSIGGSLGYFSFINEWVRPFIGISGGHGVARNSHRYFYEESRTVKSGGRFFFGVAISAFNFLLGSKEIKGLSGLTLELETGLHYLIENQNGYDSYTDSWERENSYLLFPDFGVGIYYNW